MPRYRLLVLVLLGVISSAATAAGQTYVRIHDQHQLTVPASDGRPQPVVTMYGQRDRGPCGAVPAGFDSAAYAWHNQPAPEGGTLYPLASANPAIINSAGRIAFMAKVTGLERNQGIFIADGNSLTPIAIGCGGGGGSGDPGTAVGDPSPLGGTLTEIGPGSMNNAGEIVFIAKNSGTNDVNHLKWTTGVITKHVAVGDPAPGGGVFSLLAGEALGFVDGTWIPIGDVPGINDAGQVSFFGIVQGGVAGRGLFVTTGGVHEACVWAGETTPAGGTYFDFQAPLLNDLGKVAFFADVKLGPSEYTAGWFVGTAGNWRKALAFYDEIAGGEVCVQAISRNPIRSLDNCGNLLAFCTVRYPDSSELDTLIISPSEGDTIVVAQEGDANVLGGSVGGMNGWPAMNNAWQGMLSCYTPGTPGGIYNAHFVFSGWPPGDLNGDWCVDQSDLGILLADWGCTDGDCLGDCDNDGDTDQADLGILLAHWGEGCP
jgi:hypothetical protein